MIKANQVFSKGKIMNKKDALPKLIHFLKNNDLNIKLISQEFGKFTIKKNDVDSFLFFKDSFYTRNLIYKDDRFELMTLCWKNGHETPVHNHNNSVGFMSMIYGSLEEKIYKSPQENSSLDLLYTRSLKKGDFSFINDSIGIHSIKNTTSDIAISLHLYFRPIERCFQYNLKTNEKTTRNLSFYSKSGIVSS